jgi:formate/nitrite transporter
MRTSVEVYETLCEGVKTRLARTTASLFVLSVMAGIYIGLGAAFMLTVKSDAALTFAPSALACGAVFSLGLFAVMVAGAELFTGDALLVLGAATGHATWAQVLRIWVVVFVGNGVGAFLVAALLAAGDFGSLNQGAVGSTAVAVAQAKSQLAPGVIFARAILCNFLVCLAVWMATATSSVTAKFLCGLMPVAAFVAMGFEHCIANLFFFPLAGLLAGTGAGGLDVAAAGLNLVLATAGNIVGGAVALAGLYHLAYKSRA